MTASVESSMVYAELAMLCLSATFADSFLGAVEAFERCGLDSSFAIHALFGDALGRIIAPQEGQLSSAKALRRFGQDAGKIVISHDFDDPLPQDVVETFE